MEGRSSDGESKPPPEGDGGTASGGSGGGGEPKVKRKMKTAAQLEVLEETYKVETYPSEALRADLSAQLGLTDRQLQMWFCHRRLKERKAPSTSTSTSTSAKRSRKEEVSPAAAITPAASGAGGPSFPNPLPGVDKDDMLGLELGNEPESGSGTGSSPYRHVDRRRGAYASRTGVAVPRISGHGRCYEPPPQSVAERRAIAFVEAQLGESLREDGPGLGMEFDPLPPGAFGAPIVPSAVPQKPAGRPYEASIYEHSDLKIFKGLGRPLHEYQFLPEQPTVRSDSYERGLQSQYYGSPPDDTKTPPLSGGCSYMHNYEEVPVAYSMSSHMPSLSLSSQQVKTGVPVPSTAGEYDAVVRKSPYMGVGMESPYNAHQTSTLDNALMSSERLVVQEDDVVRVERKRKNEEARLAREMEVHEKKMRKELEKQDILRRKREEQMRKEMERLDRERRKEEERLLRERQREEERYQKEQRREMERREKILMKESIRAEKMRQKEELRREREVARQKAANDRAVARRLAKESLELIEDERLELMEMATSGKGLPSIVSLDSDTLQNFDSFRDMLRVFPPKSVQLKKPFAIQPWRDSEENVGNLLMVWRFLITFADVLGLWPFTLDEFVQAFHDYDPRLLGVHIALLRTIIKDVEDVARTPSNGVGLSQNSVANPGGGHPHVVEGAYAWGFDICSWQHNLSPLTWQEIFRQFALSAGFGPKLKKRKVEQGYYRDDDEGDDGNNIISNLRTGAAVENAVAIMRERGYSNPRRSRHRLTPGTVKFAAFHVLSLEGSRGLNILDVADKIQKSGLRDLTTSKTPEASIAAALSRDTKLFERTAPSTYCVRSPFRKDPVDAEAILATAREKIRIFKSGFAEGVEADVDVVEADDVEKEDDSESDTAEDPEVDDLGHELAPNKDLDPPHDLNQCGPKDCSDDAIGNLCTSTSENTPNGLANVGEGLSSVYLESFKELNDNGFFADTPANADGNCHGGANADHEDTDVDESFPGEPWVQGLMEGDYSTLSIEERLNALVSLIDVAIEGNSIRVVLEERLEAATALKKQMWAEAQLDKRHLKEEYLMKTPYAMFISSKTDSNVITSASDSRWSPLLASDENNNEKIMNPAASQNPLHDPDINAHVDLRNPGLCGGPDNVALQQSVFAAERSRALMKSYIWHKAEEMYVYKSLPLGQDRRRNRYWQFIASASCHDDGAGRIFVELHNCGGWRLIDSEEAFDALVASLDVRGVRESHLNALLRKIESLFRESVRKNIHPSMNASSDIFVKSEAFEVPSNPESSGCTDSPNSIIYALNSESSEPSTSFHIESGKNNIELKNALRRYKDFEEWMWRECLSSSALCATKNGSPRCRQLVQKCDSCCDIYYFEDKHCLSCHETYAAFDKSFDFSEHVAQCEETKVDIERNLNRLDYPPPRTRLLKAILALVEACIPSEALRPVWLESCRKSWAMKLHMSSSAEDLLEVLTLLEGAIKRDFLSINFQTTSELLAFGNVVGCVVNDAYNFGSVTVLPWIPQTTSAVALRLMELDSAIAYLPDMKDTEKDTEARHFIKHPSKYIVARNIQADELVASHGESQLEDAWLDLENEYLGFASARGGARGRGRGRNRGGRSQRRVAGYRGEPSGRSVTSSDRLGQIVGGWKGRSSRGKGDRKRGRQSIRSRQKPIKKVAAHGRITEPELAIFNGSPSPPGFSGRNEWNSEEIRRMQVDEVDVNDDSNSERSEYEDDNGQASGDEYDEMGMDDYAAVYNGKAAHLMDVGDYNMDFDEDENNDEVGDDVDEDEVDIDGGDYEQGDVDVGGYLNADSDDKRNRDEDGEHGRDEDEEDTSDSYYSSD